MMQQVIEPVSSYVEQARRQLPRIREELAPHGIEVTEHSFVVYPPHVEKARWSVRWELRQGSRLIARFWPGGGTILLGKLKDKVSVRNLARRVIQHVERQPRQGLLFAEEVGR